MLKPDEDEGEIDNEKHKYDISKIIDFPGFNSSPGDNFYDVSFLFLHKTIQYLFNYFTGL